MIYKTFYYPNHGELRKGWLLPSGILFWKDLGRKIKYRKFYNKNLPEIEDLRSTLSYMSKFMRKEGRTFSSATGSVRTDRMIIKKYLHNLRFKEKLQQLIND